MNETKQQTILIVDDNPANLDVLAGYLYECGFEILIARSGSSALQKAAYVLPDLILLDVMMPDQDGFEVCRQLKTQDNTRDIPVIFMTALADVQHKVQGFQVGAVDFLTKPLQQEEVLARVKTHLRLRQLTHDLEGEVIARTAELTRTNEMLQHEIAERIEMQEQLAYQAQLLDQISDAVISTDSQLIIRSWNRAATEMYGYTPEEAIGNAVGDLLKTEFPVDSFNTIAECLKVTGQYHGELLHHDREGRCIPVWSGVRWMVKDGEVGFVYVNRDLTGQKEAEAQRMELAKITERTNALSQILTSISHDLKTPLASIEINLYMLERLESPEKQRAKIQAIKAHTNRIHKLIDNLIAISRLDHVPQIMFKPVDLNRVIQMVENDLQDALQKKNHRLTLTPGSIPAIEGNEDELYRAVINIVENAIHYTPENGHLHIDTFCANHQVVIEVRDNGIGIPQHELPHIFERFYRADRARDANGDGSGLGLAIVKRIMDIHQGKIEVESEENRGTIFRLFLPQVRDD